MPDELSSSMAPRLATDMPPRAFKLLLFGLMLGLTLAALDQNIVATALPRITDELGGLEHLSWVVTGFMVTSTVTAPLYGRLSDLYGRRPVYIVSIVTFLIGSMLCGLADSMLTLILFRAVQGLGAGGLIVLAQTSLADMVSPRERGRYQGLFGAVFTTCSVAGPLLGGIITQYASWRWIFYVNLPVGAVALALIVTYLPKRPTSPSGKLDYLGAVLMMAGTSCLLLMLSWGGNAYAWLSPTILGLGVAAGACLILLIRVERRAEQPIFPHGLFRNGVFVMAILTLALAAMALFAAVVFLPLMFQLLMGASPLRAGLMIVPLMAGVITASTVTGRIVARTGRAKTPPVCGLFVATSFYFMLAWAVRHGWPVPPIEVILAAIGLGIGSAMPNLTTVVQNAVQRDQLGAATATAAFCRSLGGSMGVAMSGALVAIYLNSQLTGAWHAPTTGVLNLASLSVEQRELILSTYRAGLSAAFTAGATIAAMAFISVLFLPDKPLQSRQS